MPYNIAIVGNHLGLVPLQNIMGWNVFTKCKNVRLFKNDIEKIHGWEKITTTGDVNSDEIRLIFYFLSSSGNEVSYLVTAQHCYKFTPPTTLEDITDVFFGANTERVNGAQFKDLFIFTNNKANIKKHNGISATIGDLGGISAANITLAKTLEVNNSHCIIGNVVLSGVRDNKYIAWSDKNAPETWVSTISNLAGNININETPDELLRIKKLGIINVAYKNKSIWLLLNIGLPFIFVKRLFTESIGIVGSDAVIEWNNVHYLVGSDLDIYRFDAVRLDSLGAKRGIKDYILSQADTNKISRTTVGIDTEQREIYFTFDRKETSSLVWENKFDVVYNYEEDKFSIRDSMTTAMGLYKQAPSIKTIDSHSGITIDQSGGIPIDLFGVEGIPVFKPIIGDKNGNIYRFNYKDSFDGNDIDSYFETADETFAAFIRRKNINNLLKQMQVLGIVNESLGVNYDLDVNIGYRNSKDRLHDWENNSYALNGDDNGMIETRLSAKMYRLKIGTKLKNQFFRLQGFEPKIEINGEVLR